VTKRAARLTESAAALRITQEETAIRLLGEYRLDLTEVETRIAVLEREYMARCQTAEFRRAHRDFAQPGGGNPWLLTRLEKQNEDAPQPRTRIDVDRCIAWIAAVAHYDRATVRAILAQVTQVFILRDLADPDCPPPAALMRRKRRAKSAHAQPPPVRGGWWKNTSWIKL
jgi:hypothetical protein